MIKLNRKTILNILFCMLLGNWQVIVFAQRTTAVTLNIDSCYAMARQNYPLITQYALIEKSREYTISNLSKGYLPQIALSGQVSYQTEVTGFPVSLPNVEVSTLSKDQYKVFLDINQPVTDIFTVRNNLKSADLNAEIERQRVEVELYQLRERVNQLFFGIVLINAQTKQTELMKKDIQSGIDKATVSVANGTSLKSSVDILNAELLVVEQKLIDLQAIRRGYANMLSKFIGLEIIEQTVFEEPAMVSITSSVNRPELSLLETQKEALLMQKKLLMNENIPRISLFAQGGYGRPGLNFLSNDFSPYAIGGIRVSWNISNLYSYGKRLKEMDVRKNTLNVQKDLFLLNTDLALTLQDSEIAKLETLIASDHKIIELRERVKNSTKNMLENGTATTNDYILHLNAEDKARQNLVLHQIQRLMALYNHKTTSGN